VQVPLLPALLLDEGLDSRAAAAEAKGCRACCLLPELQLARPHGSDKSPAASGRTPCRADLSLSVAPFCDHIRFHGEPAILGLRYIVVRKVRLLQFI
jgi:hypothetical protein